MSDKSDTTPAVCSGFNDFNQSDSMTLKSRRDFLKTGAAAASSIALATMLPTFAFASNQKTAPLFAMTAFDSPLGAAWNFLDPRSPRNQINTAFDIITGRVSEGNNHLYHMDNGMFSSEYVSFLKSKGFDKSPTFLYNPGIYIAQKKYDQLKGRPSAYTGRTVETKVKDLHPAMFYTAGGICRFYNTYVVKKRGFDPHSPSAIERDIITGIALSLYDDNPQGYAISSQYMDAKTEDEKKAILVDLANVAKRKSFSMEELKQMDFRTQSNRLFVAQTGAFMLSNLYLLGPRNNSRDEMIQNSMVHLEFPLANHMELQVRVKKGDSYTQKYMNKYI